MRTALQLRSKVCEDENGPINPSADAERTTKKLKEGLKGRFRLASASPEEGEGCQIQDAERPTRSRSTTSGAAAAAAMQVATYRRVLAGPDAIGVGAMAGSAIDPFGAPPYTEQSEN